MSINKFNIKKEIVNELRNADLISTTSRGVTTTTDEFNGDDSTVTFTLTQTGVKNIRSVTVDTVAQTFGTDWVMSDDFTQVIFTSAPATGTNNVDIQYDYGNGNGDKIYPDFAKPIIKNEEKFPRIGFDIISTTTREKALQSAVTQTNLVISFVAYSIGIDDTEQLSDSLRNYLLTKKLNWYYLNFLTPNGEGPLLPFSNTLDKVYQRNIDFIAPYEFET